MDKENLYLACQKMLSDKYNISDYSKTDFDFIYTKIYNEHNTKNANNDINKQILITIKDKFLNDGNSNNTNNETEQIIKKDNIDIDNKIKELEHIRANMNNFIPTINQQQLIKKTSNPLIQMQPTQIIQQQKITINKHNFKTFIINTIKNNFKITSSIDIKSNYIYPCQVCVPSNIKNKTPYIIISINDGIKNTNYTFIPSICNNIWDIWTPIINNYIDINLNTNVWNINFIDFLGNHIDFGNYYFNINSVLENTVNETFTIGVENSNVFNINDKVKIIQENNLISENIIVDKINNEQLLIIKKNKLSMNSFINAKIFNYNNQYSIIFKYISKE